MPTEERMRRVNRRHPCPVCGKPDWCGYTDNIAICMRVSAGAVGEAANGGWIHRIGDGGPLPSISPVPIEHIASRQVRDQVYSTLLHVLPLRPNHYQQLLARGFTEEAIDRRSYRTLPPEHEKGTYSRAAIAFTTRHLAETQPEGVPGFAQEDGVKGPRWTLAGPAGLLIPVHDMNGYIVGCQVRLDRVTDGGKYRWLSSKDLDHGTGSGAPLHVSRPARQNIDTLFITEGPLKADRAAESLGATVLAVPGVATWREVPGAVRQLGARHLVMAFDMDLMTNSQVRLHAQQLLVALQEIQIPVPGQDAMAPPQILWARWEGGKAKGIDDALQAGLDIEFVPIRNAV